MIVTDECDLEIAGKSVDRVNHRAAYL